jgi:hypothetical protein
MTPGASAKLTLWRKGDQKTFSLTLGEMPKERDARAGTGTESKPAGTDVPKLGLMLAPAGQVARCRGPSASSRPLFHVRRAAPLSFARMECGRIPATTSVMRFTQDLVPSW